MAAKKKLKMELTGITVFTALLLLLQYPNISNIVLGQSDTIPFELGNIIGSEEELNQNPNGTTNDSSSTKNNSYEPKSDCVMPPCPPGYACIQSCP
jgi:hypothetical protein